MAITCVEKLRDKNNKIVAYRMQDENMHIGTWYPEEVKKALEIGATKFTNLKLTSDGRIISKSNVKVTNTDTKINFDEFYSKLKKLIIEKVKYRADNIELAIDMFNSGMYIRNINIRINNEFMNNNILMFKIMHNNDKVLVNIYSYDCIKYGNQVYVGDCTKDSYSCKLSVSGITEGSSFLDSCISRAFYSYRSAK